MVRGLYTAYTGMVNSQHRLDVVSNNLANATTTGYKKEGCTTQSFDAVYGIKIKDATVGHVNQMVIWLPRMVIMCWERAVSRLFFRQMQLI